MMSIIENQIKEELDKIKAFEEVTDAVTRLEKEYRNVLKIEEFESTNGKNCAPNDFTLFNDMESKYFALLHKNKKLTVILVDEGFINCEKGNAFALALWNSEIVNGIHNWDGPAHKMMLEKANNILFKGRVSYNKIIKLFYALKQVDKLGMI